MFTNLKSSNMNEKMEIMDKLEELQKQQIAIDLLTSPKEFDQNIHKYTDEDIGKFVRAYWSLTIKAFS